jgi:hypothetical protein
MDSLVIFLAGYALGAKAGSKGYAELVKAATAVKESEEVRAMLRALRTHVGHTLREVGDMLDRPEPLAMGDVLERARRLVGGVDPRTKAS